MGGERIAPRVECDLDYEAQATAWSGSALEELARRAEPDTATVVGGGDIIHVDFAAPAPASLYSKVNPFAAEITESINLNSSRSTKQTIHLEVSLEGSGSPTSLATRSASCRGTTRRWSMRCCAPPGSRATRPA